MSATSNCTAASAFGRQVTLRSRGVVRVVGFWNAMGSPSTAPAPLSLPLAKAPAALTASA